MKHLVFIPLLLLLLTSCLGKDQDFQRGYAAYDSGDYVTAIREWTLLAQQGSASAQYNLGQMYRKGQGVPEDNKIATKWYRLAAEQGHSDAQYSLGLTYAKGEGVPQDSEIAVKWYRLAAKQGYAFAQNNLGVMYFRGEGVPQDYIYAYMWGDIAASNRNEKGDKTRDAAAAKMSSAEIFTAKILARKCMEENYRGC